MASKVLAAYVNLDIYAILLSLPAIRGSCEGEQCHRVDVPGAEVAKAYMALENRAVLNHSQNDAAAVQPIKHGSSLCKPRGAIATCRDATSGQYAQKTWFEAWAYDKVEVAKAAMLVQKGSLVKITNALTQEVAESLHYELWHSRAWKHVVHRQDGLQFSRQMHVCKFNHPQLQCPPLYEAFHRFIAKELKFWSQFSIADAGYWSPLASMGWAGIDGATWYRFGDFASPHNDVVGGRVLSFVLSLSKDWNATNGGSFWWLKGEPRENKPEFNTLYLFLPRRDAFHMVSSCLSENDEQARRLAITGWFYPPESGKLGAND